MHSTPQQDQLTVSICNPHNMPTMFSVATAGVRMPYADSYCQVVCSSTSSPSCRSLYPLPVCCTFVLWLVMAAVPSPPDRLTGQRTKNIHEIEPQTPSIGISTAVRYYTKRVLQKTPLAAPLLTAGWWRSGLRALAIGAILSSMTLGWYSACNVRL